MEKRDLVPIDQGRSLQTVPPIGKGVPVRRRWLKAALALAIVVGGAGAGLIGGCICSLKCRLASLSVV